MVVLFVLARIDEQPDMARPAPKRKRRTQEERSAAMQTTLLEATLQCLGRDGYAATSISSIIEEAGVSRGALLHHFPTKTELIANAIVHFYRQRLQRFSAKLLGADTGNLSLADRLLVLKNDFETWYDTALEIEVALRTNPEIFDLEQSIGEKDSEEMTRQYEQLFPEFVETGHARALVGVACYLMRGLAGSTRDAEQARQFRLCVDMLQGYLDSHKTS